MHFLNSFVAIAALAAAPIAFTQSLAVEHFIAKGQSLAVRHSSIAARQSLANLPTCAQPAIEKGITSTTCSLTDYTCICHSTGFIDGVNSQIKTSCGPDDQKATLAFADQVCTSAGAPLKNDAAPAAAPAASAPADSAPMSSAEAPAPTMSSDPASSTASMSVPTVTPPYPVSAGNASGSANGTNATTPFLGAASASHGNGVVGVMSLTLCALFGVWFL